MRKELLLILLILPLAAASLQEEAESVLYQNAYPTGFVAGSTHFSDVWARDALYASWGATDHGLVGPVRGTLNTLAEHQSLEGQIPLRVGAKNILARLAGLPVRYGAVYSNDKSDDPALDPNCLYVITLHHYVSRTGDEEYARAHRDNITAAMRWLQSKTAGQDKHLRDKPWPPSYYLLDEEPYASWDDALEKEGASIYNNACYYASLRAAAELTDEPAYAEEARAVQNAVNAMLWNGDYYDAWQGRRVLDVPGNLFAIHYGLANTSQAASILERLDEEKREHGNVLTELNYPRYRLMDVYFPFYALGMGDYHNQGPQWSWVAALEAQVREENGQPQHAAAIREELARWVEESGSIHEVYDKPGKPVDRIFYDSEKDFSWTAGLILYNGSSLSRNT